MDTYYISIDRLGENATEQNALNAVEWLNSHGYSAEYDNVKAAIQSPYDADGDFIIPENVWDQMLNEI